MIRSHFGSSYLALALAGDIRPVRRACAMVVRERLASLRRNILNGCSGSVHCSFNLDTGCQKVKFPIILDTQVLERHHFSLMVSALGAVSAACDSHHVMDRGHPHGASGMSEACLYIKDVRQDTVDTKNKPRNKIIEDIGPLPKRARKDNARPPRAEPSSAGPLRRQALPLEERPPAASPLQAGDPLDETQWIASPLLPAAGPLPAKAPLGELLRPESVRLSEDRAPEQEGCLHVVASASPATCAEPAAQADFPGCMRCPTALARTAASST